VTISRDPDFIARADKVVMPGQGGFGDCARALGKGHGSLASSLREQIARGTPFLGICLGLQVLFHTSEEACDCEGLGLFDGTVVRLAGGIDPLTGLALKIPHIGWNVVTPGSTPSWLPPEPAHFYFVHSYVVSPKDPAIIASTTDYGGSLVSAVVKDNVFACQFHPEKSQRAGLALLERFVAS
jgi:glutamine amidotransferase